MLVYLVPKSQTKTDFLGKSDQIRTSFGLVVTTYVAWVSCTWISLSLQQENTTWAFGLSQKPIYFLQSAANMMKERQRISRTMNFGISNGDTVPTMVVKKGA